MTSQSALICTDFATIGTVESFSWLAPGARAEGLGKEAPSDDPPHVPGGIVAAHPLRRGTDMQARSRRS